jgi:hypothetical protein
MCNCIKTTKEMTLAKLREIAATQTPPVVIGDEVELLGTGLTIKNNTMLFVTHNELKYTRQDTKKDGSLGQPKKVIMAIIHSFCPFCGEKQA